MGNIGIMWYGILFIAGLFIVTAGKPKSEKALSVVGYVFGWVFLVISIFGFIIEDNPTHKCSPNYPENCSASLREDY